MTKNIIFSLGQLTPFFSKERGRKGQMFVIGAILILIGLIVLKNLLGVYSTAEEKRYQESVILDKHLRNVRDEYKYIIATASMQNDANASGISYLSNFSSLIRNDMDSKIVYMFIFANGTTQKFSVNVGNFVNDKINVTVNATNSNPNGYVYGGMDDKTNLTREFNATINGTINVTLKYLHRNINFTETVPMNVSTKNLAAGFFDITLVGSDIYVRTKETYNRSFG